MDPFGRSLVDPFSGGPGDPMENVLSLQTLSGKDGDAVVYQKRTGVCHLNCFVTNSCWTDQCDGIGATDVCQTNSCSYGSSEAGVTIAVDGGF